MQVVHPRCCGLDVHKKTVVACVLITREDGTVERALRTLETMTGQLEGLSAWLRQRQVTHVAMESTGVYGQPVYNLLEGEGRTLVLVNAQHSKALPGRKTDTKDSEWLADLLRHGLVRGSFIPPAAIRALRELTRYRTSLVQERSREANRLQKLLESANIKLASVATNVLGVSGRLMLQAMLAGEDDPEALAAFARASLRKKLPELRQALEGRVQPHHRVLLGQLLGHVDYLTSAISELEQEIERHLVPFAEAVTLLQTIPGIGATAAAALIAEVGVDMTRFPTAKHLASWAGVCPGNRESAGKRLSGKIRTGNRRLRGILGEVAWASARTKGTAFRARMQRLARRRGAKRATVAVAHSLLVTIYHVLSTKRPYQELGEDYFDRLHADRLQHHRVQRLEQLGYTVTLAPKQAIG